MPGLALRPGFGPSWLYETEPRLLRAPRESGLRSSSLAREKELLAERLLKGESSGAPCKYAQTCMHVQIRRRDEGTISCASAPRRRTNVHEAERIFVQKTHNE
eukprot:176597-Pleurochrysis_carterae.AAC.2